MVNEPDTEISLIRQGGEKRDRFGRTFPKRKLFLKTHGNADEINNQVPARFSVLTELRKVFSVREGLSGTLPLISALVR